MISSGNMELVQMMSKIDHSKSDACKKILNAIQNSNMSEEATDLAIKII